MVEKLFCSPDTCRHIGLLFGERLDTLFTSSDSKISGFTRSHAIAHLFPLWRADLFCSGFAVEFAGCVWTVACPERKFADSKILGDVWTGPQSCLVIKNNQCKFLVCIACHSQTYFGIKQFMKSTHLLGCSVNPIFS